MPELRWKRHPDRSLHALKSPPRTPTLFLSITEGRLSVVEHGVGCVFEAFGTEDELKRIAKDFEV
jgi:hypothetical protein